jgi:hypothetical protein
MKLQKAASVGRRMPYTFANFFGLLKGACFCAIAATAFLHLPGRLGSEVVDDPSTLGRAAARRSAIEMDVPLDTLISVGHRSGDGPFQNGPWTASHTGTSILFNTSDQSASYVFRHFKRGSHDFEIGCFQLNYRMHGQSFTFIEQMFDADMNARIAAKFLKKLQAQSGNWTQAATDFHLGSQIPQTAARQTRGTARLRFDSDRSASLRSNPPRQRTITLAGLTLDDRGW